MVPVAFAMLLSVAAGLSLAAEHIGPRLPNRPTLHANSLGEGQDKSQRKDGGTAAKEKGVDTAITGTGGRSKSSGVGSRALTGNEAPNASDQPEMAIGVDLKGRPLRFPAADTPE
jgi:hypothetical protein